jgi:hypothetical protein
MMDKNKNRAQTKTYLKSITTIHSLKAHSRELNLGREDNSSRTCNIPININIYINNYLLSSVDLNDDKEIYS